MLAISRCLAEENSSQPYVFAKWDCAVFTRQAIERFLGRQLTQDETARVTIDYRLDEDYSPDKSRLLSMKEAYDLALAHGDERLTGAPGFLVREGLACYKALEDLTETDIERGVIVQISWHSGEGHSGGGHSGILSGVTRGANEKVTHIRVITAHSRPDPQTGRTGAYEAEYPIDSIKHITVSTLL
jgi:hypothetical protein